MGIQQLGYVGFGVSDLGAWETMATRVLGLSVSDRGSDGTLYLRMDDYQYRIALVPDGSDDLVFAGWQVANGYELKEMVQRLRAGGVEVTDGTEQELAARKVRGLIKFRDPSGNPFEIFWGPLCNSDMAFSHARPISGFKAGSLGLGHLVLNVKDLPACEEFYLSRMGLQLTDYGQGRLAFFRCNPRHHSLAVVPDPAGTASRKMAHLMLQVLTLDDVGTGLDAALKHDVQVTRGLGKHTNDYAVSFYVETPSGFEIEYGFGAREVDESTWFVPSYPKRDPWGHHPYVYPSRADGAA